MTTSRSMNNLFGNNLSGNNLTGNTPAGTAGGGWLNMPTASLDQPDDDQPDKEKPNKEELVDIGVIGMGAATPYPLGAYCMEAPDALRAARTWPGILDHHDFDLHGITPSAGVLPEGVTAADYGNLDLKDSTAPEDTSGNRALITATIRNMLGRGTVPFVFGGDDSIPIPVLAAYDTPLSILQIDAHIDWRDDVEGERFGLSSNMRRASEMPHVGTIVQLGARGIGSARGADLHDALAYGASFHTSAMLTETGGIARAIAGLPKDVPVYIALDIDCLDPAIMPAVIGPAPGGLSYRQLLEIFTTVAAHAPIAGFNLVEFMPEQDHHGQGAEMASRVALSALGVIAGQIAKARG